MAAQFQAVLFLILLSRYAHLQTNPLGTVDQNMQDPLKKFTESAKLLIPFPWASKIAIFPSLPLQTWKDHTKELWDL